MKSPNKIYVNIPGDYWHPGPDKVDTDTEYIRKDVVLGILEISEHLADAASKIYEL